MADEKKSSTGGDQGQKPASQPTQKPAQQENQAEKVKPGQK